MDGNLALITQLQPSSGANIWQLSDGLKLNFLPLPTATLSQIGFISATEVLMGDSEGLHVVNVKTGAKQTLKKTNVESLAVSPDGSRALIEEKLENGHWRVQFIDTHTLQSLSGWPCETACPLTNTVFAANSRSVTALVGRTLLTFRENQPASTILRDSENAAGIPLKVGAVLSINDGVLESRNLLTGRRESTLSINLKPKPISLSGTEQILGVNTAGELLETNNTLTDNHPIAVPARLLDGGLDQASDQPIIRLLDGSLKLGKTALKGQFTALQSRNKSTWALNNAGELYLLTVNQMARVSNGLSANPSTINPPTINPPTTNQLAVNHWGNFALIWNDSQLVVFSQALGKTTISLKFPAGTLGGAALAMASDATRVFVLPAKGEIYQLALANAAKTALPMQPTTNTRFTAIQVSGTGSFALSSSDGKLSLYKPNSKTSYATFEASSMGRFSLDSRYFAFTAAEGAGYAVQVANTETGKIEAKTPILSELPSFLAWNSSLGQPHLLIGSGFIDDLSNTLDFALKP